GEGVVRRDVLERDEKDVHRCLGVDVLEGNAPLIAHHELGGDVAVPDLAKHAIGHGRELCPSFHADVTATSRHAPGARLERTIMTPPRWLFLVVLLPFAALAEPRTYRVAPVSDGSKAEAVVVYSLGTHTQTAQDIRGEVTLDTSTLSGGS